MASRRVRQFNGAEQCFYINRSCAFAGMWPSAPHLQLLQPLSYVVRLQKIKGNPVFLRMGSAEDLNSQLKRFQNYFSPLAS